MNRRTFLVAITSCAGIALGGWASSGMTAGSATSSAASKPRLSERLSYDALRAYVSEAFRVYGGKGLRPVISLQLVAVQDRRLNARTEQFTARFKGPGDVPLPGDVYTFDHPSAGQFSLLLEPAGVDAKGRYYRALFNLLQ